MSDQNEGMCGALVHHHVEKSTAKTKKLHSYYYSCIKKTQKMSALEFNLYL